MFSYLAMAGAVFSHLLEQPVEMTAAILVIGVVLKSVELCV